MGELNSSEKPNKSDLIERQAAIDQALIFFVEFCGGAFHENGQKELIAEFQRLPSAQPEPSGEYARGYNDAKREIALSGEYERAYQRGKADAQPEIIRCKECKYYGCELYKGTQFERGECFGIDNSDYTIDVSPDDFCSRAKRREDG